MRSKADDCMQRISTGADLETLKGTLRDAALLWRNKAKGADDVVVLYALESSHNGTMGCFGGGLSRPRHG
jgi:hypothetical protein